MKKLVLLAVALVAAVVPLAGCSSSSEVTASLGQTFEVPIHHAASLPAEGLLLTFQQVSKDSRCPRNVQCVTAGEADYTVRFTKGSIGASLAFNELGGGGYALATFLDYSVNASLLPYPEQAGGIPPEDYSVRLTVTPLPVADAAPADDTAAIYAAVIRQLLTRDNNQNGGTLDVSNLYLDYVTSDATGIDPTAAPDAHQLSASLRDRIASQLADLTTGIRWAAGQESVPLEGTQKSVANGGVTVNLGNLHADGNGGFQVYAGLYLSSSNATGRVYIVKKVGGTWQVTGDTGVVWSG